jgi:hypothetical protein
MNWQVIAVILIVSCAVLYLARQLWASVSGGKGCGGGCGCSAKPTPPDEARLISPQQITLRRSENGHR